ncbi:right-handed parallel beta-helix repeat-containing protein [Paenibacillus sp. P36]|uniref:right-handed parallel beta-helix repeat-containing protein n=1 Tax=Paenibacillus sp. P36 TaxID=3342538 RepID=UPI0038B26759
MAIIEVFPNSQTAIQDAVTMANEGDVILVHRGVYHESVQVSSIKNNIRIISKHKQAAILDGRCMLLDAFELNGVAGVEIYGFKMINYLSRGIQLLNAKSNHILSNKISDIGGGVNPVGIFINNSIGNLVMQNVVERIGSAGSGTGIHLQSVTGSWVIKNKLKHNSAQGIEVIDGSHNAIVGNQISHNKGDGILVSRVDNNLIYDNKITNNGNNGVNAQSTNTIVLDSKIKGNRENGLFIAFNYNFAGFNEIKDNKLSGIQVISDFNDIQNNKIENNENNGVYIHQPHTANLVFANQFKRNNPNNIKDEGENNNIIQNTMKD